MIVAKRPWGVSLISILYFINVGVYLVLLVLAIAAPETLRSILGAASPAGSGPAALLNLGPLLAIYFAVMAGLVGLLGYGMWTLRNWARWVTSVIAAISLIGTLFGLVELANNFTLSAILLTLLRVGLSLLVLWYMWTPSVRAAFRSRSIKVNEERA